MANQTVIFYYSWCSICQVKTNLVWALVNYIVLIVVFAVFPALYEMPPLTDRVYGKTNCKGSLYTRVRKRSVWYVLASQKETNIATDYQFSLQVI